MNEELEQLRVMLDDNGIEHVDRKDVTILHDDRGYNCTITIIDNQLSVGFVYLSCEQALDIITGNKVTVDELVKVRGVGPKLAEAIVNAVG